MEHPGNYLHGVVVRAISPNSLEITAGSEQHAVPFKQCLFGERLLESPAKLNHHLRDSLLGRLDRTLLRREAKLLPDG
jgi:hypothetical protein